MNIEERIGKLALERQADIISVGDTVWKQAEMGYKEYRTAGLVEKVFRECGLHDISTGLAITGVKGYLKPPKQGEPVLAIIGEMDALPISNHPDANPETGASHCCGHNAQIAALLGSVYFLTAPEVASEICGNIAFMAVPAEEFVDTEFKNGLMEQGKIEFGGGKCELIRIGAFDDISLAIGHHVTPSIGYGIANGSTNGFVNKVVHFRGRAAHAAAAPDQGEDALNAALLAIHALDVQRETFRDQDNIRVHSFLPQAGTAMNVVADEAAVESSVRANNIAAVKLTSKKYDRAMRAGALALGCSVEISTFPGYLPTIPVKDPGVLTKVLEEFSNSREPMIYRNSDFHENGSTDFGDLSQILPVLQFRTGGYSGELHNANVRVTDPVLAYVRPAEIFAVAAVRLMRNNAEEALKIVAENPPLLTKDAYIAYMREMKTSAVFPAEELPFLID